MHPTYSTSVLVYSSSANVPVSLSQQSPAAMSYDDRPPRPPSQKEVTFSRRQIEGMIADRKTIIIVDGWVLRVDPWLKYHPGGDKAIMHMVGRDATDEVNA